MEVIRFLGEHTLVSERIIIVLVFVAAVLELVDIFSKKCTCGKKEKIFSFIIAFSYIGEGILFVMKDENMIINSICTVLGVTLLVCLILRVRLRNIQAKADRKAVC